MNPNQIDRRSFLCSTMAGPAIAAGLVDLCAESASAQENADSFADLYYIRLDGTTRMLSVLDGEVWFRDFAKSPRDTLHAYEQAIKTFRQELTVKSLTSIWRYRDEHLIAYFPHEERVAGRYVPGVEGKYLSADYSTLPPRVVLTATATEASRWELTPVEDAQLVETRARADAKYVRNFNRGKHDAWLALSKNEYVRDPVQLYSLTEPILSFEQKTPFHLRRYFPDDTSK